MRDILELVCSIDDVFHSSLNTVGKSMIHFKRLRFYTSISIIISFELVDKRWIIKISFVILDVQCQSIHSFTVDDRSMIVPAMITSRRSLEILIWFSNFREQYVVLVFWHFSIFKSLSIEDTCLVIVINLIAFVWFSSRILTARHYVRRPGYLRRRHNYHLLKSRNDR